MLLPERDDPRWRDVVGGRRKYALQSLAARMLVTRLRLRTVRGDEEAVQQAIASAWDFFERNEATTQADIDALFGGL
ncbi:MAG: hypothetical protein Q8L48_30550 [Archangium sp.]|nr:hypothetical protein [Archangium sp.]